MNNERPYVLVDKNFLESESFSWSEKLIYIALQRYAKPNENEVSIQYEDLISICGSSRSTIAKILDSLQEKGMIERVKNGKSYSYILNTYNPNT